MSRHSLTGPDGPAGPCAGPAPPHRAPAGPRWWSGLEPAGTRHILAIRRCTLNIHNYLLRQLLRRRDCPGAGSGRSAGCGPGRRSSRAPAAAAVNRAPAAATGAACCGVAAGPVSRSTSAAAAGSTGAAAASGAATVEAGPNGDGTPVPAGPRPPAAAAAQPCPVGANSAATAATDAAGGSGPRRRRWHSRAPSAPTRRRRVRRWRKRATAAVAQLRTGGDSCGVRGGVGRKYKGITGVRECSRSPNGPVRAHPPFRRTGPPARRFPGRPVARSLGRPVPGPRDRRRRPAGCVGAAGLRRRRRCSRLSLVVVGRGPAGRPSGPRLAPSR
jgi:hypothetical protein